MSKTTKIGLAFALLIGASLSMQGVALSQDQGKARKVSYEQAFKLCKAALDKESPALGDLNGRYARGGACLAKFGYSF